MKSRFLKKKRKIFFCRETSLFAYENQKQRMFILKNNFLFKICVCEKVLVKSIVSGDVKKYFQTKKNKKIQIQF